MIREARPGDGAALARIWTENAVYYVERFPDDFRLPEPDGLVEWLERLLARERSDDVLWLVADVGGEPAGYLSAHLEPPAEDAERQMLPDLALTRLIVDALGTAEAHQRRGVATALVAVAEQWARDRGATVAGTETYAESAVSLPFWEKAGYRRRSMRLVKPLS